MTVEMTEHSVDIVIKEFHNDSRGVHKKFFARCKDCDWEREVPTGEGRISGYANKISSRWLDKERRLQELEHRINTLTYEVAVLSSQVHEGR